MAMLHKIIGFLGFSESETFWRPKPQTRPGLSLHTYDPGNTYGRASQSLAATQLRDYPYHVFHLPKTRCKNLQTALRQLFALDVT
jgi:hypothetical protein